MIDARIWLLDAAVEHGVDLRTLADPKVDLILNREAHGHPPDAIASILARMAKAGEIMIPRRLRVLARHGA